VFSSQPGAAFMPRISNQFDGDISFRAQLSFSFIAYTASVLKISDLNVLAAGIGVNSITKTIALMRCFYAGPLPTNFEHITSSLVGCAVYTLVSNCSKEVQMTTYLALMALDISTAGPLKTWELLMKG
jgi:hypothetical protein